MAAGATPKVTVYVLAKPSEAVSPLPGVDPSVQEPPFSQLAFRPSFQVSLAAYDCLGEIPRTNKYKPTTTRRFITMSPHSKILPLAGVPSHARPCRNLLHRAFAGQHQSTHRPARAAPQATLKYLPHDR